MTHIIKAMTAEDRILAAVLDIKNIKDRKGTASDDAVRVILNKWWIPSNSKIANTLKWYSHNIISDNGKSVIDIANTLVEHSAMDNNCQRYDVIHEVLSNGFKLPEGAGLILSKDLWFSNEGTPTVGRVDQIGFNAHNGCYDVFITLKDNPKKFSIRSESKVFLNRTDLELAIKNKFIKYE